MASDLGEGLDTGLGSGLLSVGSEVDVLRLGSGEGFDSKTEFSEQAVGHSSSSSKVTRLYFLAG